MFKFISLFILFSIGSIFAQDLVIPDNPFENVPDAIKQRKSFNRERWFYEQRMYPNNYIPADAYIKAMDQKMEMRKNYGFSSERSAWSLIGPTPGFYFSYSNISGRIATVKYDPVNPNTIYIGAAFGGVWKSTNTGLNWMPMTDNEPSLSSGSIAIDPQNPNIIYYGTGEATYSTASYYGRGILKSTNGGLSWTNYIDGLPTLTYCSRIAIKPGNSSYLMAAMGTGGLFRSTNGGVNWIPVYGGFRCDDVIFSPDGNRVYIAGSGTGLKYSTDGGESFVNATGAPVGTRNHLALCKSTPNIVYMTRYSGSTASVYKSVDAGATYTLCAGTLGSASQAWYDYYIQVSPFDPNYVYVGLIDIFRSTDGGNTFTNITNGYSGGDVHVDQHNMDFHPTNVNELMVVNDGGVWKSTNRGNTWINLNTNLALTQFYRMTSDPTNANHLAGGTQDNGTQRTTGTMNWAAAYGGDGGEVCFQSQNPLNILGETQNNGVFRSINGGLSFSSSTSGLTGTGAWVGPIISHPTQINTFYTARQQVFISTNMGALWSPISSSFSTIREMAISKSNPNVMMFTSSSMIYRSTDAGTTFTQVNNGTPGRVITSIYIHPDSSNVAVVSYSGFGAGKIYKTTNGGTNWMDISGNLPDSPCNDVLIFYPGYSTNRYYAAMDIGVFVTENWGTTWTELADGLPNTVAMHLDYNQNANKLRIGTHGRSTWELTPPTGIVNYSNELPANFSLQQNYPNPFNPVTNIKFSIAGNKAQFVNLKVYNSLGQVIETLVNKELNPGTYTMQFDAGNMPSGVYFYKIISGSYSETKNMILVK